MGRKSAVAPAARNRGQRNGATKPEQLDLMFAASLNAKNIDALLSLYEVDAVLQLGPQGVASGVGAVRQALLGFINNVDHIEMSPRVLASATDIALTSSSWSLQFSGQQESSTGISLQVCRRQANGEWRYVLDIPAGLG